MMTNNYANELMELTIGMNQSIDELKDYCFTQFDIKDVLTLDPELLVLLQKSMKLMKTAQDYSVTTAKLMQQFDRQLYDINKKLDTLLSK